MVYNFNLTGTFISDTSNRIQQILMHERPNMGRSLYVYCEVLTVKKTEEEENK